MNTGKRIKRLRKMLDLTQQKFGERLGIKGNTVAQYELGKSNPVDSVVSLICREFNVNEKWLRNGEGEMFNPAPTNTLDQLAEKYRLSNADYVMIEKFVNLRPEVRQNIYDYFREVVSAFAYEDIEPHKISSPQNPPDKSWENGLAKSLNEQLSMELQEKSVEELEEAYKKSRSDSVSKTTLPVSSITNEKQKHA